MDMAAKMYSSSRRISAERLKGMGASPSRFAAPSMADIYDGASGGKDSLIVYGGLSIVRKCARPTYYPVMPSENNWAPAKMDTMEARKGKPCTGVPFATYISTTYTSVNAPNPVKTKPIRLAIRNG